VVRLSKLVVSLHGLYDQHNAQSLSLSLSLPRQTARSYNSVSIPRALVILFYFSSKHSCISVIMQNDIFVEERKLVETFYCAVMLSLS